MSNKVCYYKNGDNMKKKIISIIAIIVILVGGFIGIYYLANNNTQKSESGNLIDMSGKMLKEKVDNKESFIMLVTRKGCSHCEDFLPVFINVLEKHDLTAYKLDLANLSQEEKEYLVSVANVTATPTTVFIEDGEEKTVVNRIVGATNKKRVEDRLKALKYIK